MPLIVILDDQVTNRRIFEKLAASIEAGVTVRSFADPRAAFEWFRDGEIPDLIVTDYKMPYMNGAEFIRAFRERPEFVEIPIIVITVYEERDFRMQALEAGATDFLQSPVNHQEFVTRARNLLKLRKQQLLLESRARTLAKELASSEQSREAVLRDSTERLAQVIDTVPAMVSASDAEGRILFANAFLGRFVGKDPTEVVGQSLDLLNGRGSPTRNRGLDRKVFETGQALASFEEELVAVSGKRHVFLTTKSPLRDGNDVVVAVLTSSLDITERKQAEAHLTHLAHHDPLTDLPNRVLLSDRLRREVARARRGDRPFALHLVDLDEFKSVNDLLGHSAGDRFLIEVARRLRGVVGPEDTVARVGGDEFAVLQTRLFQPMAATDLARRLHESISQPYDIDGAQIVVGASIGIAVAPDDALAADTLLAHADMALYRAKSEGRGITRFFEPEMDAHMQMRRMLELDLRGALERNEFELHYQPVVGAASARIEGFEALLRWRHPERGLVSPVDFIPVAEEIGLIGDIGAWVLREATRVAAGWPEDLRIAVNISPVQIKTRALVLDVLAAIGRSGLRPDRLELEITEGMLLVDTEATLATLAQFRDIGVRIAMDDFGTGYSSLGYLRRFAFDKVKIDQSFVRGLGETADSVAIVRAVTSLCSSLGITTTAEGVETEAQRDRLRLEGCDQFQGWLYGRPMPEAEVAAHLAAQTDTVGSSVFSIRHPRGRHGH